MCIKTMTTSPWARQNVGNICRGKIFFGTKLLIHLLASSYLISYQIEANLSTRMYFVGKYRSLICPVN